MKTFSKSGKKYNRQLAVSYIAYMMAGSYFEKCQCVNPCEEEHLFLHYAEMPQKKQYEYEEKILKAMNRMDSGFRKAIGNLRCSARCGRRGDTYLVAFETGGFESVLCAVKSDGEFEITHSEAAAAD